MAADEYVHITSRIPGEQRVELRLRAKEEKTSVSTLIREAIDEYLGHERDRDAQAWNQGVREGKHAFYEAMKDATDRLWKQE